MSETKKVGRPTFAGEKGTRVQVTIPLWMVDKLRELGGGNLSKGVIRLLAKAF